MSNPSENIAIICHGGAWSIPDELVHESVLGTEQAVEIGWKILKNGGSALDAVEKAINAMEDNPVYDAGIGSSLNDAGNIELDAIIVDGKNLEFGAVAGVENVIHTVSLARKVLEKTDHVMLIGKGANLFVEEINFENVAQDILITKTAQKKWEKYKQYKGAVSNLYNTQLDTVGAVAIDKDGNIAAGTSTGGITGKKIGRVGDSPIIGSGAFADNSICGVSTTGHGESILKVMLAKLISEKITFGLSPKKAANEALHYMKEKVQGNGGAIVINSKAEIGFYCTTEKMAWSYKTVKENKSGIK